MFGRTEAPQKMH